MIKNFQKIICLCLASLLIMFSSSISSINIAHAITLETTYTNVLDDLSTDKNFSIDDYPEINEDYSIKVIQIAESTDNELFVYCYQPSGSSADLRAKYLNMALDEDAETSKIYSLELLNSSGTLYKYKVSDFEVSSDTLRYYYITSVYREFINGVDTDSDYSDQSISYVSLSVGQLWQAYSYGNSVFYSYEDIETIEIASKYVGFVRYTNSTLWVEYSGVDRYFVAFSTNKKIDNLLEATVYYKSQSAYIDGYTIGNRVTYEKYGDIEDYYSYLSIENGKVTVSSGPSILGYITSGFSYSWDEIMTVEDFINSVDCTYMYSSPLFDSYVTSSISDEELEILNEQEWVLSFAMPTVTITDAYGTTFSREYTIISDVSILRLKFETDGVVYSLGVVDNMQTGSSSPINTMTTVTKISESLISFLKTYWYYVVLGLIALIFFIPVIKLIIWVLKMIFNGIKFIFNAILSLFKK